MIPASQEGQIIVFDGVNESVRVVDTSRPKSRQIPAQRLKFADSFEGVTHCILNQGVVLPVRGCRIELSKCAALAGGDGWPLIYMVFIPWAGMNDVNSAAIALHR